jgi:hypothetical protein
VARDLTEIFEQAESTRDVDNYMRDPYEYWRFDVDTEKAVRRGISVDTINRNMSMALGGTSIGDVKQRAGHEPVKIVIQVPLAQRSEIVRLGDLPIMSQTGATLPLRELGEFRKVPVDDIIYHKDLRPVEYVVADVGGQLAAPVYAMLQVEDLLKAQDYTAPDGVPLESFWLGPPPDDRVSSFEWAGEWTVTYETFRDMGAAFMVALVLIYILVVWEFGNFRIPLVIMAPIPLTLLGIIPAHFIMFYLGLGGEFTATSMIGWIALAGIIVRNSILLVDFSIHEVQRGIPVAEAVIRACKTRTRPIMITAWALVFGSSVIFTDPIFQGMAISLASGVMVSTILTLVVIPLGCINASKALCEVAAATAPTGQEVPCAIKSEPLPAADVAKQRSGGPSWVLTLWGHVANALIMVFYAIRGIFLLLGELFRRKKARPPSRPGGGPATSSTTGPKGSGPSGGGGGTGGGSAPPTRGSSGPGLKGGDSPAFQSEGKASPAPKVESPSRQPAAGRDTAAPAAPSPGASSPVRRPDPEPAASRPSASPAPATEAKAAAPGRASSPRPVAKVKPSAPARSQRKAAVKKGDGSATKGTGAANAKRKSAAAQKKASRRGIRLKLDDEGPPKRME